MRKDVGETEEVGGSVPDGSEGCKRDVGHVRKLVLYVRLVLRFLDFRELLPKHSVAEHFGVGEFVLFLLFLWFVPSGVFFMSARYGFFAIVFFESCLVWLVGTVLHVCFDR